MALQCFWMLFQTVERAGMFDEKEAETSEDGLEIFLITRCGSLGFSNRSLW